jgi:CheY-like chemotaxis protein
MEPDERERSLLVVEDDDATRSFLVENLTADGFRVAAAAGAGEGLRAIEVRRPDLVVLDLMLGDASGLTPSCRSSSSPAAEATPTACAGSPVARTTISSSRSAIRSSSGACGRSFAVPIGAPCAGSFAWAI